VGGPSLWGENEYKKVKGGEKKKGIRVASEFPESWREARNLNLFT
jgi:hypothetical protein